MSLPVPEMPQFRVVVDARRVQAHPAAPRLLTQDEERILLLQRAYARWRGWDDIAADRTERMVRYNLRLAMHTALHTRNRVDLAKLYSLCAQGILRAVEDFDIDRPERFSTYATQKLRCALSTYYRYLKSELRASRQLAVNDRGLTEQIVDTRQSQASEVWEWGDLIELIHRHVSPKDAELIILRHGLAGEAEHTLKEIGDLHQLTRERVRQRLIDAHARLREAMA